MKTGDILNSKTPEHGRAIVFSITKSELYIIVTDFGNISQLNASEVNQFYNQTHDSCNPIVWLNDKIKLIKRLKSMFPELSETTIEI